MRIASVLQSCLWCHIIIVCATLSLNKMLRSNLGNISGGSPVNCEGCQVTGPGTIDCSNFRYTAIPKPCLANNITSLDLSGNSIYSIDAVDMAEYTDLVDLNIASNMVLRLKANVFSAQKAIQRIVLKTNRITSIVSQAFSGCSQLQYLDFAGNDIVKVSLRGLPMLYGLDLSYNALTALSPFSIVDLPELSQLDLSNNKITVVYDQALVLPLNLTFLSFANNLLSVSVLESIPVAIRHGLTTLHLDQNLHIHAISPSFLQWYPSCIELRASGLNLTAFLTPEATNNSVIPLERLDLSRNNLTTVPIVVTGALSPNLITVSLSANQITSLGMPSAPWAPEIISLDLSGNNFAIALPPGAFTGLNQLQVLQLIGCSMVALRVGVFEPLSTLTELYLSFNALTELPASIFAPLRQLNVLQLTQAGDLSGQPLPPNLFWHMGSLSILSMSVVNLQHDSIATTTFANLTSLSSLALSGNADLALPSGVFSALRSLETLELCGSGTLGAIGALPASLVYLGVCDGTTVNNLTSSLAACVALSDLVAANSTVLSSAAVPAPWEPHPILPVSLSSLDLSFSNSTFAHVAKLFGNITGLSQLSVRGNRRINISADSFENLRGLEILDLSQCELTTFPFSRLLPVARSLVHVDLSYNNITQAIELDAIQNGFAKLSELYLVANQLKTLVGLNRTTFPQLEVFDVSSNVLTELSTGVFNTMPKLQTLDLSRNALTYIASATFARLPVLASLDLGYNAITTIAHGALWTPGVAPRLALLNLAQNALGSVPSDLQEHNGVQNLDLSHNDITALHAGALSGSEFLRVLVLANN
eukprot:m.1247989 g.1247989  ORF g.1247989 m.1247989 type:complete len:820 (-) comp24694_c0_seq5:461-2920(-)